MLTPAGIIVHTYTYVSGIRISITACLRYCSLTCDVSQLVVRIWPMYVFCNLIQNRPAPNKYYVERWAVEPDCYNQERSLSADFFCLRLSFLHSLITSLFPSFTLVRTSSLILTLPIYQQTLNLKREL